MEKIKTAVIGCGTIANFAHIPGYMKCPNAEIKYFCDIVPEKADKAVKEYGIGKAVYDHHEILDDPEIKAVSVCTPNGSHEEISVNFLKAGKAVLCEKPAAKSYDAVERMLAAQKETNGILCIGVVNRFNSSVNYIRDLIQSGELGEVYEVYASFRRYRGIPGIGGDFTRKDVSGGGAMIDFGVHFLDIVMYCTGDPNPLTVSAKAFSKLGSPIKDYVYEDMWAEDVKDVNGVFDVDDYITGFIRTDGPAITLNGSWAQNIGVEEHFIDFLGTKAGIRFYYGRDFTVYTVKDGKLFNYKPEIPQTDMFQCEIDSFVNAAISGQTLQSDIRPVSLSSKIIQGIYDSSELNKEIVF